MPDRLGREDVGTADPVQASSRDPAPAGEGDAHTLDFTVPFPGQSPGPIDVHSMLGTGGNDRIGHLFPDPGHIIGTLPVFIGSPPAPDVFGEAKGVVVEVQAGLSGLIFKMYKCNT